MIRILLVDDQEIVRDAIAAALGSQGDLEVVAAASSGAQALELARQFQPTIVVTETILSDLSGIDAAKLILEQLPETRILALTSHEEPHLVCQAMNARFSGYVLKRCPFSQLLDALRAVSHGQMYLCPQVVGAVVANRVGETVNAANGSGTNGHTAAAISDRERQVLQLVANGLSTKEIADQLTISLKTVETHRRRVMAKLKLFSIAQLTKYAIREGFTTV